jgi:hypothetical protein
VYEEEKEQADYPMPRSAIPQSRSAKSSTDGSSPDTQWLQSIALHHLVRGHANRFSQKILELDSLFSLYFEGITDDQVKQKGGGWGVSSSLKLFAKTLYSNVWIHFALLETL